MKVNILILICSGLLSFSVLAVNDSNIEEGKKCDIPEQPNIPNGRAATEKEIVEVQKKVKAYIKKGEQYLQCIAALEQGWEENVTPEQKRVLDALYNGMVDAMESVANSFNTSVRTYKGKNPKYR